MKVVTAAEMQEIDRITIEEMGMPGEALMGLAGKAVADYITGNFPALRRIAVFCGTGNNGGDGFFAAYLLVNRGFRADICLIGSSGKLSAYSRVYYLMCINSGVSVTEIAQPEGFESAILEGYDCVVDAITGTGFKGAVKGVAAEAIKAINDSDAFVVAVDVPSGLGSDGVAPDGEAVIADCTVTIGLPKISLVTYPGKNYGGELYVADIGFPASLSASDTIKNELIDGDYFTNYAIREIESEYSSINDTHKGERGYLLLIGGFDGMEGAAVLAARAAFETGLGLAVLATTVASRGIIAGMIPELITMPLASPSDKEHTDHSAVHASLDAVFKARKLDALILGPGMGRSQFSREVFNKTLELIGAYGIKKVLIDGDGLYHLAGFMEKGRLDPKTDWVVTPHFMEASRILGSAVDDIKRDRLAHAVKLAQRLSCAALLKGPATIVSDGERSFINTTGNPAMAAAGSGDVLAGIIGALMLRRLTAVQAAACGAWIHGRAGDLFCEETGDVIMKSTDLLGHVRKALALIS